MHKDTNREQLNFSLVLDEHEDKLPLSFFSNTSEELRKLFTSIEKSRLGGESSAKWYVNTNNIRIITYANGVSTEELQEIITDAYEGFRVSGSEDDKQWPVSFDEPTKEIVRKIVSRIKRTSTAKVEAIGHEPLVINVEQAIIPRKWNSRYAAWSSIDGKLDVISVRRQPYFVIYEHGINNRVRCVFPDEWMPTIKELLGQRVLVEGFVHYREDGSAISLSNPTEIKPVPDPTYKISEFRGAIPGISGNLSSYEYIRAMREGSDN